MEICQIFIRNIFLIIIELSKLKSGKWSGQMFSFSNFWEFDAPSMNQKPGKGNFRALVSKKIPRGACPRAPLEACSLVPSFRKSVSIYPRSAPEYDGFFLSPLCAFAKPIMRKKLFCILKIFYGSWSWVIYTLISICISMFFFFHFRVSDSSWLNFGHKHGTLKKEMTGNSEWNRWQKCF